jgi:hypothetical protein
MTSRRINPSPYLPYGRHDVVHLRKAYSIGMTPMAKRPIRPKPNPSAEDYFPDRAAASRRKGSYWAQPWTGPTWENTTMPCLSRT